MMTDAMLTILTLNDHEDGTHSATVLVRWTNSKRGDGVYTLDLGTEVTRNRALWSDLTRLVPVEHPSKVS